VVYIFSVSVFLIFYAYFGYPLTLYLMTLFRVKNVHKAYVHYSVTLIIAAHNEEMRIRDKIENVLALNYPKRKLQVVVASDGSTDNTNAIVREYADQGIELLEIESRKGKENAQKLAVANSTADILIFSDVSTSIEPNGLKEIVANFSDSSIGCVSSVDCVFGQDGKPCGEGLYVQYEMWLRNLESRVSSLVGLSGSFFAARREVCLDFSTDMDSDFRTVLNSVKLGMRGVDDSKAIGCYPDVGDSKKEFYRKVRTVLRGMTVFFRNLELLNVFRFGLFSYQYFCHKLLRWLVPFFLLMAMVSNAYLAAHSWYFTVTLFVQLALYGLGFWGWYGLAASNSILVKVPHFFLMANFAVIVAWLGYLRGERMITWTPSVR